MIKLIETYPIYTLLAIVFLMLGVSFNYLDITIMEARNFITAREMLSDNNWLLTTMNGEPRYQKPPFPTWMAAVSAFLFGLKNSMLLRLPGIFMAGILGVSSYYFSKKLLLDKWHSFANGLITITSFYVIAIIIEAPWDIFAHGFTLLGVYHLFQLFEKKSAYWKHTLLAGLFIGLSILSKGPVSFYALLLPFLISYGIVYKYKDFKLKAFSMFSVLIIALVIGGWWYLYVRLEDPATFLNMAQKETGNWSSYNVRPFYYYWSFFTQSGIWTIPALISLIYPYMIKRVRNVKAYKLTFYWTIIVLILLSIIPEKKSRYLMPILIPLALNTGFYISYLVRKFKEIRSKTELIPVYFNFGLIALVGLSFSVVGYMFLKDLKDVNWFIFFVAATMLALISLFIIWQLKKKRLKHVFYLVILFVIASFVFVSPLSKHLKTHVQNPISELREQTSSDGMMVYGFNYVSPEMIWQFGNKLIPIKIDDSTLVFPNESKFGILVKDLSDKDEKQLKEIYNLEYQETFDLNVVPPDSKKYRTRLVNSFYILTKK